MDQYISQLGLLYKIPQVGGLKSKHGFSHSSGGYKARVKLPANSVSYDGFFSWFADGYLLAVTS